ncbi:hypothetical protein NKH77_12190 [Streptomyces sp. M19]
MSTTTRPEERTAAAHRAADRGGERSPLFRNAYALMLNTGISAVLGLGFWLAAAGTTPRTRSARARRPSPP